jgi:hypothetical protein
VVRLLQRLPDAPSELALAGRRAGQIWAQTELRQEELLVTEIDVARATRAMFEFERGGMADVLFANTVRPEEFATAGPLTA